MMSDQTTDLPPYVAALAQRVAMLCSETMDPTGDLARDASMEAGLLSSLAGSLGMAIGVIAGSAGEHRVRELHEIATTAMERAIPKGKSMSASRRAVQRVRHQLIREAGR